MEIEVFFLRWTQSFLQGRVDQLPWAKPFVLSWGIWLLLADAAKAYCCWFLPTVRLTICKTSIKFWTKFRIWDMVMFKSAWWVCLSSRRTSNGLKMRSVMKLEFVQLNRLRWKIDRFSSGRWQDVKGAILLICTSWEHLSQTTTPQTMTMKPHCRISSIDCTSPCMAETDGGVFKTLCGIAFAATVFVHCVFWQLVATAAAGFRVLIAGSFRLQIAWNLNETASNEMLYVIETCCLEQLPKSHMVKKKGSYPATPLMSLPSPKF